MSGSSSARAARVTLAALARDLHTIRSAPIPRGGGVRRWVRLAGGRRDCAATSISDHPDARASASRRYRRYSKNTPTRGIDAYLGTACSPAEGPRWRSSADTVPRGSRTGALAVTSR